MTKFQMYDVVRVVHLPVDQSSGHKVGTRGPRIGDTGTVVMAYESPREGYTVEAIAGDGRTEWILDFTPEELERL